jgi:hypothetical protein
MNPIRADVYETGHYLLHFPSVDTAEPGLAPVFVQMDMENRGTFCKCHLHGFTNGRAVKPGADCVVFEILVISDGFVFVGQKQLSRAQSALSAKHESDPFGGISVRPSQIAQHFVGQRVRNT